MVHYWNHLLENTLSSFATTSSPPHHSYPVQAQTSVSHFFTHAVAYTWQLNIAEGKHTTLLPDRKSVV